MINDGAVAAKPWHCSLTKSSSALRLCMPGMLGKSSDHEQNWGFHPLLNFSKKIFSPPLPISFQKLPYAGFFKYFPSMKSTQCVIVYYNAKWWSSAQLMQYSASQCSAVQCSAVQCSAEPYSWEDLHNPAGCLKSRQKKCILYCELQTQAWFKKECNKVAQFTSRVWEKPSKICRQLLQKTQRIIQLLVWTNSQAASQGSALASSP